MWSPHSLPIILQRLLPAFSHEVQVPSWALWGPVQSAYPPPWPPFALCHCLYFLCSLASEPPTLFCLEDLPLSRLLQLRLQVSTFTVTSLGRHFLPLDYSPTRSHHPCRIPPFSSHLTVMTWSFLLALGTKAALILFSVISLAAGSVPDTWWFVNTCWPSGLLTCWSAPRRWGWWRCRWWWSGPRWWRHRRCSERGTCRSFGHAGTCTIFWAPGSWSWGWGLVAFPTKGKSVNFSNPTWASGPQSMNDHCAVEMFWAWVSDGSQS